MEPLKSWKCSKCGTKNAGNLHTCPQCPINEATKPQNPVGSALTTGSVTKLSKIADEFIGFGQTIHEHLEGQHPALPDTWAIQEVYENYKTAVRDK